MVEQPAVNRLAVGSNPTSGAIEKGPRQMTGAFVIQAPSGGLRSLSLLLLIARSLAQELQALLSVGFVFGLGGRIA